MISTFSSYNEPMVSFDNPDFVLSIIKEAKIGLWKIETEDNKPQRLYANDTVYKLLGVDGSKLSPEDYYKACFDKIEKNDKANLRKAFRRMMNGNFTEAQFAFTVSPKKTLYFKVAGFKNSSGKKVTRYEGVVRDITNIVKLQQKSERQEMQLTKYNNSEITFFGIAQALFHDFESVYYVNIHTGQYSEYIGHGTFKEFKFATKGENFYEESIKNIPSAIYIADQKRVIDFISKENIIPAMLARKTISIRYRIVIKGEPLFYRLTAAPSVEQDSDHYIIGVQNIEENVKQEKEYAERIRAATEMANSDALTGVKNRLAYERAEERMNEEIAGGTISPFAIGVFDVNNLKKTNDKYGHEAGDVLICESAKLICAAFSHSPVFRIGGDEFAVIMIGADFFDREKIISKFRKIASKNKKEGRAVVSSGFADFVFSSDLKVIDVFDRADAKMYENKKKLKKK